MAMLQPYSIECLQAALIPFEHKGSRTDTVSAQLTPETIRITVFFHKIHTVCYYNSQLFFNIVTFNVTPIPCESKESNIIQIERCTIH